MEKYGKSIVGEVVDLIDVSLVCDTNSKLVDIVTFANVDDEDCIGNSLLQIW